MKTEQLPRQPLAAQLRSAMDRAGVSVDRVAERTKVPRATLRALLGESGIAVLPPRVYLRAHVGLVAQEIGADEPALLGLFDQAFPPLEEAPITSDLPRFRPTTMALAAGIGGVGVLAVILAFAG